MNPEVKDKWLTALRSGKYEQGKQRLQTADGKFCCLGVLCDLYAKETGTKWTKIKNDSLVNICKCDSCREANNNSGLTIAFMDKDSYPPDEVVAWAGLPSHNPDAVFLDDGVMSLSLANDLKGQTFSDIADAIERTF